MSHRAKREIAQIRKHRANTRVAERWAAQRMAVDLSERDAEIEQLKETIRAFGRGDIVPITDKDAEIERLRAALKEIAERPVHEDENLLRYNGCQWLAQRALDVEQSTTTEGI